jgi:hypothetical protein
MNCRTAPIWAAYPGDLAVDCSWLHRAFEPHLFWFINLPPKHSSHASDLVCTSRWGVGYW